MQIYSLQIEKHVLGGLIKHPHIFPDVDLFLTEDHFHSPVHGTIYLVIRSSLANGEKIFLNLNIVEKNLENKKKGSL